MSIASDTKVFVVIMFDRAARVLFGCSADEFFDFAKSHPSAGTVPTSIPFSRFFVGILRHFEWKCYLTFRVCLESTSSGKNGLSICGLCKACLCCRYIY